MADIFAAIDISAVATALTSLFVGGVAICLVRKGYKFAKSGILGL